MVNVLFIIPFIGTQPERDRTNGFCRNVVVFGDERWIKITECIDSLCTYFNIGEVFEEVCEYLYFIIEPQDWLHFEIETPIPE